MANMIPATPPGPGPGMAAEAALWHALRQGLDDGFFVYARCGYDAGGPGGEGEVDFLVVHRELGMLAIECKGRGVEFQGGRWMREEDGKREPMTRGPFEQARQNAHALAGELERRAAAVIPGLPRLPFAWTHAVAFPRHDWTGGALPPEAREQTLLDSRDLATIGDKIRAALALAREKAGRVEPLEPAAFKKFRKHVIAPRFKVVLTIGSRIRGAEPQQVRLSENQRRAARGWIDNPRFRVTGGAGTGKTLAAVEAARLMAAGGRSVLLLCYNKALAGHLAACLEGGDAGEGSVEATSFHRLCAAAYRAGGRKMDVPPGEAERSRFWLEEAPYVLLEAVADGKIARRGAVVVDEGQDFAASWWEVVEALLEDPEGGRVLVFCDPAQDIFGRGPELPPWPGIALCENFRNARAINEVVCRLGGVRMESTWDAAEGEEPRVFPQGSAADTLRRLEALVGELLGEGRLLPDQVTVLTPHTRQNSTLAGVEALAGIALADDPSDRDGRVLHTTIGAFKGLESDVVILVDIDPSDPLCNLRARYVAASRARHALYVFSKGEWEG
jgi:hypothetical protein